jgi:hypothetical protein
MRVVKASPASSGVQSGLRVVLSDIVYGYMKMKLTQGRNSS